MKVFALPGKTRIRNPELYLDVRPAVRGRTIARRPQPWPWGKAYLYYILFFLEMKQKKSIP